MNYRWMSAGTETVNTEERFKLEDMNLMTFENNSSSLDHDNFFVHNGATSHITNA